MKYQNEIREFVINNFLYGDAARLLDNESFMDSGIVDSTGILELITFLEKRYEIRIEPEEMLPDNLDSVSRVAAFLARKKSLMVGTELIESPCCNQSAPMPK